MKKEDQRDTLNQQMCEFPGKNHVSPVFSPPSWQKIRGFYLIRTPMPIGSGIVELRGCNLNNKTPPHS
jgi:hypothetical protein